jgi:hypothetical protein
MKLSSREKWIGIGAVALLGALVFDQLLLSPLLIRLQVADTDVAETQRLLSRAQQVFQNSTRARKRWNELAGTSLTTDASAAESQLLNRVRDWSQGADLSLSSLKPERTEREKDFQKATIRATGSGSMQQIARFLNSIHSADIPVRISDLQITSRKEGTDDLQLQIGIATIFVPPQEASR